MLGLPVDRYVEIRWAVGRKRGGNGRRWRGGHLTPRRYKQHHRTITHHIRPLHRRRERVSRGTKGSRPRFVVLNRRLAGELDVLEIAVERHAELPAEKRLRQGREVSFRSTHRTRWHGQSRSSIPCSCGPHVYPHRALATKAARLLVQVGIPKYHYTLPVLSQALFH